MTGGAKAASLGDRHLTMLPPQRYWVEGCLVGTVQALPTGKCQCSTFCVHAMVMHMQLCYLCRVPLKSRRALYAGTLATPNDKFVGCTDGTQNQCTNWWNVNAVPTGGFC
jgi:hypothetical protein